MEVGEENLTILGRVVATELLVKGSEGGESVVSLDAPPVVESFNGYAGKVFTLRVDSSHCRQVQGRRGRGGGAESVAEWVRGAENEAARAGGTMSAGVSVAGQNRAQLSGGGSSLDVQETHSGGGNAGYGVHSWDTRGTGSKRVRGNMWVAEKRAPVP